MDLHCLRLNKEPLPLLGSLLETIVLFSEQHAREGEAP